MNLYTNMQIRRDRLARDLEEVEAKLDLAHGFGDDEYEEHAVIRFDKTLGYTHATYAYAAIKCKGYWYISGPVGGGKAFTWEELIAWLLGGTPTRELWRVDTYIEISRED